MTTEPYRDSGSPPPQGSSGEPMITLAQFNEVFGTLSQVWASALEAGVRSDLPCMEKARALLFPEGTP